MRLAWLLLLLLALPCSAAAPVELHWHLVDGYQDGVLSTQAAPDNVTAINRVPALLPANDCIEVEGVMERMAFGSWRAVTSVSGAWYDTDDDGSPTVFGSAGLGLPDAPIADPHSTLHWYVVTVADTLLGQVDVPALPQVVVEATLRAQPLDLTEDLGPVLAQGRSGPATLAADQTVGAVHHMAGDRHVYEFEVPIEWQASRLPSGARDAYGRYPGLAIDVEVHSDVACPDGGVQRATAVGAYSGPSLRPRLGIDVGSPLRSEYLHPQSVGDEVVVHFSPQSVWGKYDVGAVEVTVTTPQGETVSLPDLTQAPRFHEHSPRDPRAGAGPIDRSFVLDVADRPSGNYTVRLVVKDLGGANALEETAFFEIAEPQESPAAPVGLLGLSVLGLALLLRRR